MAVGGDRNRETPPPSPHTHARTNIASQTEYISWRGGGGVRSIEHTLFGTRRINSIAPCPCIAASHKREMVLPLFCVVSSNPRHTSSGSGGAESSTLSSGASRRSMPQRGPKSATRNADGSSVCPAASQPHGTSQSYYTLTGDGLFPRASCTSILKNQIKRN